MSSWPAVEDGLEATVVCGHPWHVSTLSYLGSVLLSAIDLQRCRVSRLVSYHAILHQSSHVEMKMIIVVMLNCEFIPHGFPSWDY